MCRDIDGCGTPKAEVLGRVVSYIDPLIYYHGIHDEVQAPRALEQIVTADVITGTDTATSRRFVSEVAQQYLRPLFNARTDIDIDDNTRLRSIATSFQGSGANRTCLDCLDAINPTSAVALRSTGRSDRKQYGIPPKKGRVCIKNALPSVGCLQIFWNWAQ